MAAVRQSTTTALKLYVENGVGKNGNPTYAIRTVPSIAGDLPDDDALDIGQSLVALQTHTLGSVKRVDTVTLAEA